MCSLSNQLRLPCLKVEILAYHFLFLSSCRPLFFGRTTEQRSMSGYGHPAPLSADQRLGCELDFIAALDASIFKHISLITEACMIQPPTSREKAFQVPVCNVRTTSSHRLTFVNIFVRKALGIVQQYVGREQHKLHIYSL